MNSQEAASLATREANPVIDGRKANVNLAYLGAKPRVIPTPTGKNILIFLRKKKCISIDINQSHRPNSPLLINYSTSSVSTKKENK
jgi:hypothetical protein